MLAPLVEPCQPLVRRRPRLVGDIVGAAGKGVDRGEVRAQVGRHETRGDRKVLVVRARNPQALGVGGRSPLRLGDAGAMIGGARHHEQQVRHTIQVDQHDGLDCARAEGKRRALRAPADGPRQVQRRPTGPAARRG